MGFDTIYSIPDPTLTLYKLKWELAQGPAGEGGVIPDEVLRAAAKPWKRSRQ
jgi:hypothetical protein